jgi:hypothetical protein
LAVCAIVIFEVFDGPIGWIQVNIKLVVESLARIFDENAKVRDVVEFSIRTIFDYEGSLDWTNHGYPSRLFVCLSTAHR